MYMYTNNIYMYTHVRGRAYICVHVCTPVIRMYVYTYVHMYMYVYIYMYICICMYICVYIYVYVHVCLHDVCRYVYTCAYMCVYVRVVLDCGLSQLSNIQQGVLTDFMYVREVLQRVCRRQDVLYWGRGCFLRRLKASSAPRTSPDL